MYQQHLSIRRKKSWVIEQSGPTSGQAAAQAIEVSRNPSYRRGPTIPLETQSETNIPVSRLYPRNIPLSTEPEMMPYHEQRRPERGTYHDKVNLEQPYGRSGGYQIAQEHPDDMTDGHQPWRGQGFLNWSRSSEVGSHITQPGRRTTLPDWGEYEVGPLTYIPRRSTGLLEVEMGRTLGRQESQASSIYEATPPALVNRFIWDVEVRWYDRASLDRPFGRTRCQMRLDTGCEASNWVAESVVRKLSAHAALLPSEKRFVAFNGELMVAKYEISLDFLCFGGEVTCSAMFLVAEWDCPFDMVLGAPDCERLGILNPSVPSHTPAFLGLAAQKLSKAQQQEQKEREEAQAKRAAEHKEKRKQLLPRKKLPSDTETIKRPAR